jgi:hypothetical protein
MKTKAVFILTAGLAAIPAAADTISIAEAPPAVQQAIESRFGSLQIESLDRQARNGQITYQASVKTPGAAAQTLVLSEAGTVLRDVIGPSTATAGQNVTLANRVGIPLTETPLEVQNSIHNQLRDAPIDSIQRGIWNGQNVYEITYHDNGRLRTLQVSETGQPVVSDVPATPWAPRYSFVADAGPMPGVTTKLAFNSAPRPVQTTIMNLANGARIEDFGRGDLHGRVFYVATFLRDGQRVRAQVFDDGSILRTAGAPAVVSAQDLKNGGADLTALPPTVPASPDLPVVPPAPAPPPAQTSMRLGEAPLAVQAAVNQASYGARIDDFSRIESAGRVVYQATFRRNGERVTLQALENGAVLNISPAAGAPPAGSAGAGP